MLRTDAHPTRATSVFKELPGFLLWNDYSMKNSSQVLHSSSITFWKPSSVNAGFQDKKQWGELDERYPGRFSTNIHPMVAGMDGLQTHHFVEITSVT